MLGRAVDHEAVTDTGYPQLAAGLSRVTRMLACQRVEAACG
jgi:hypothetical protein